MKVLLETERLRLRAFTPDDLEALCELDSDPEVMRYINGGHPVPREANRDQRLPRILAYHERYDRIGYWAAVERTGSEFLGWFQFTPALDSDFLRELALVRDGEVALGYRFRRSCWGRGYATEGALALVESGLRDWGVGRVVACALRANAASLRVMAKAGLCFEREFEFSATQLPDVPAGERQAVLYATCLQTKP